MVVGVDNKAKPVLPENCWHVRSSNCQYNPTLRFLTGGLRGEKGAIVLHLRQPYQDGQDL
jgi:hypothetical protein